MFSIHPREISVEAIIDNKNLHSIIYSTKLISEKRLRIDIATIQEMLPQGEVNKITWKQTLLQIADCLTKKVLVVTVYLTS